MQFRSRNVLAGIVAGLVLNLTPGAFAQTPKITPPVYGQYTVGDDYFLATKDKSAQELFARAVQTLLHNLDHFDLGFWSLYEQSGTRLPMVASPFYHRLHIVQLRILHRLTADDTFSQVADRWESYTRRRTNRARALCYKSAFKLCNY